MAELDFEVVGWLAPADGDEAARATMGSLRISAGDGLRVPVTEVEDTIARTVRSHINVPLVCVARWLLVNWWRLRWEERRARPTRDWRRAHCMAAIGGDHAWPALEVSSDGEIVRLQMEAEDAPDVAATRYLRNVHVDVPARAFEAAVDRFVDVVEARLGALLPHHRALSELRAELAEERARPSLARACRWQALAGIDPGEAPDDWLAAAQSLADEAGIVAGDEIMSVLPSLDGGIRTAARLVEAMKGSTTAVDLSRLGSASARLPRELPWETGARLAGELRERCAAGAGAITNGVLGELLSTPVPLRGQTARDSALAGGFRNGVTGGRTRIVGWSHGIEAQRFYLARMIGAALVLPPEEHVVPVTRSGSALQQMERSFAQELLCPWRELDAFTDEHGWDAEGLAEAAEHFQVSEWLVRTTLVNRHKVSRDYLPPS